MNRRHFKQAWELLFESGTGLLFIIAAFVFAVGSAAAYDLVTCYTGTTALAFLVVFLGAVIVFALVWTGLAANISRRLREPVRVAGSAPPRRKGLILLLSNPATSKKAVEYHLGALEKCWMLHSDHPSSMRTLAEMTEMLTENGIKPCPIRVEDAFSPEVVRDKVDRIYAEDLPEGWTEDDVIADYTGMTAPASVGMVLACLSPKRPLQYTPGRFDREGRPLEPLDPVEMQLTWNAVIMASDGPDEGEPASG